MLGPVYSFCLCVALVARILVGREDVYIHRDQPVCPPSPMDRSACYGKFWLQLTRSLRSQGQWEARFGCRWLRHPLVAGPSERRPNVPYEAHAKAYVCSRLTEKVGQGSL